MHEVRLPAFEGPLDLLLHLIERDDLDITAISLVAVADQYLAAIHDGERFEPHALAEFVSIGAKLMYLKSCALLPRQAEEAAETLEEDEVGRELVDMLLEYRRYREVADLLGERQEAGMRLYPRLAPAPPLPAGTGLDNVTAEALYTMMVEVLARTPAETPKAPIAREAITLSRRMGDFRERLRRHGRFSFRAAISECKSRIEVVVCFMAILELLKAGECDATQPDRWGDIEVVSLAKAAG
ncbi:MAG: ScpA family protein [Dehalococcoidia bacterium]